LTPSGGRPAPFLPGVGRAAIWLTGAVGAGLVLVQLLLAPPASELWLLGLYMVGSGVVTMVTGGLAVRTFDRAGTLSLRAKITFGAIVGALVGLMSVLIVARLMFISTAHDLRLLAALIGFSSLVSLAFSAWVATRISADVRAVTARVAGLAAGDYRTRLALPGHDEVARVAGQLDQLAALLAASDEARDALERERRDFTIAISHDLRTPLASIRAMAEALADGVVEEPAEVQRYHAATRHEVERLASMVDDLFQLAQMDAGALALDRLPVSLGDIAAEVVDAMDARAAAAGVRISLQVEGAPPPIMLDGSLMERAVGNLLANAIEHTPPGGRVDVRVNARGGHHEISVNDTGPGIAATDLDRVWDRFFRAERSRSRAGGQARGAGLGLAIVKGIVEAHGGEVLANSSAGAGATFVLSIPADAAGGG